MNDEYLKPSPLLSLPNELWHLIMKATANFISPDELITEEVRPRHQTLRHAALAHRILQPYAQEELLRILSVRSDEQLFTLVEALEGSSRLAEYAKRTEVIKLYSMMEEGEGLNEGLTTLFEMCCHTKMLYLVNMYLRLATIARLTRLRYLDTDECRIFIDKPTGPFARLRRLEFFDTYLVDETGNECDVNLARSLFSPAQFPALCRMHIDHLAMGQDPTRFNLLLPQLSHVTFNYIPFSLVAIQLPHCTSLKTLRLQTYNGNQHTDLLPFLNSLRDLNLEEFRYFDWRNEDLTSLQDARSIMAIVGEMKTLKKLSLGISKINTNTVTKKKWIEFKEGVRKLCQKNKVEMMRYYDDEEMFERDELTWVD